MILHSIIKEERNKEEILRIREQYLSDVKQASIDQKNVTIMLNQSLKKLVSRKQAVLKHSIFPFVDLYEQFKKIHFNSSDGIEELDDFEFNLIKEQKVRCVNTANFTVPVKDFSYEEMSLILFGGIIGLPGLGVVAAAMNSSERESRQKLEKAILESEKADILIEKIKMEQRTSQAAICMVDKCTNVITELNKLFVPAQKNSSELIATYGKDKSKYLAEERKQFAVWINLAKAMKDLIDIPILGEDGMVNTMLIDALNQDENLIQGLCK